MGAADCSKVLITCPTCELDMPKQEWVASTHDCLAALKMRVKSLEGEVEEMKKTLKPQANKNDMKTSRWFDGKFFKFSKSANLV